MATPIEVPIGIFFRGVPISPSTYFWLLYFRDEC